MVSSAGPASALAALVVALGGWRWSGDGPGDVISRSSPAAVGDLSLLSAAGGSAPLACHLGLGKVLGTAPYDALASSGAASCFGGATAKSNGKDRAAATSLEEGEADDAGDEADHARSTPLLGRAYLFGVLLADVVLLALAAALRRKWRREAAPGSPLLPDPAPSSHIDERRLPEVSSPVPSPEAHEAHAKVTLSRPYIPPLPLPLPVALLVDDGLAEGFEPAPDAASCWTPLQELEAPPFQAMTALEAHGLEPQLEATVPAAPTLEASMIEAPTLAACAPESTPLEPPALATPRLEAPVREVAALAQVLGAEALALALDEQEAAAAADALAPAQTSLPHSSPHAVASAALVRSPASEPCADFLVDAMHIFDQTEKDFRPRRHTAPSSSDALYGAGRPEVKVDAANNIPVGAADAYSRRRVCCAEMGAFAQRWGLDDAAIEWVREELPAEACACQCSASPSFGGCASGAKIGACGVSSCSSPGPCDDASEAGQLAVGAISPSRASGTSGSSDADDSSSPACASPADKSLTDYLPGPVRMVATPTRSGSISRPWRLSRPPRA